MNTQNIEYSDEVKSFPIVADAFSARDDAQLEVDTIREDMEKLAEQVAERQRALDRKLEALAIADDKLALVATMAQECNERIEEVRKECEEDIVELSRDRAEEDAKVIERLNNILMLSEGSANETGIAFDVDGIKIDMGALPDDSEEVQEELALTG